MAPRTETSTEARLGVCNLCEAICGLQLTLTDGRVTGVRGNPEDPLSRGHICPKGVAIADVYDDPDRLRRPVRRVVDAATGETSWQRIGWDEAFDLAADGLAAAVNTHGRNALGIYLGNPNAHSLGSLTHGVALVKSFRTRNKFSATSVDQLPQQFVGWQMFGHQLLLPIPDLDRTVLLPGVRWQPDGLQRVADDRARLPAPAARAEGARRPDGRGRPAPHRDREGRHRAPLRAARQRRVRAAGDAQRAVRGGAGPPGVVRQGRRRGARRDRGLHPRARRATQRHRRRRRYDASRASSPAPIRPPPTAGSGSPRRSSAPSATG